MTTGHAQQILIRWLNKLVLAPVYSPSVSRSPFTHTLLENYRVLIRKCLHFAKLIWPTLFPGGHSFLTCNFLPVHWFFFLKNPFQLENIGLPSQWTISLLRDVFSSSWVFFFSFLIDTEVLICKLRKEGDKRKSREDPDPCTVSKAKTLEGEPSARSHGPPRQAQHQAEGSSEFPNILFP